MQQQKNYLFCADLCELYYNEKHLKISNNQLKLIALFYFILVLKNLKQKQDLPILLFLSNGSIHGMSYLLLHGAN